MKNEITEIQDFKIEDLIYEIRGKQVILDSDLAKIYGVETKRINEAVGRNPEKFPKRFSWILNDNESKSFLVAICDQKNETRGGRYKNPRVFTEQGVAMLSTILKSKQAVQTSIAIMDAFVLMRHYLMNHNHEKRISNLETNIIENSKEIKFLKEKFEGFNLSNNHIFYEGQIYDAYSLLLDIFETAKESIVIIDNYADKKLLDVLSKTKKKIKVYSKNMNEELIKKYRSQYDNVEVVENNSFHDRFIIVDNKDLYHCGASFKELGKKCFAISKVEDISWLEKITNYIGE